MKISTSTIIIVVIAVVLFGFVLFSMGFDIGSSGKLSDSEIGCLKQYGMSCDQYTAEQLRIRPNP